MIGLNQNISVGDTILTLRGTATVVKIFVQNNKAYMEYEFLNQIGFGVSLIRL